MTIRLIPLGVEENQFQACIRGLAVHESTALFERISPRGPGLTLTSAVTE
jgi:hypothetical protein